MSAKRFAQVVADEQKMADDAATEAMKLADAKMKASDAADAAQTAADAADAAADQAEMLLGATHPLVVKARAAAVDADAAAMAAKTASDDADASGTSEVAAGHQMTAMEEQGKAEGHQADAEHYLAEAMLVDEHNKALALKATQDAARVTFAEAEDHYDAVVEKAGLAADKLAEAEDSAERAMAARNNAAGGLDPDDPDIVDVGDPEKGANGSAEAAKMANDRAQDALARAMNALADADKALEAALAATTLADAEAALADLVAANAILTEAHTGPSGAGMAYMDARDAAEDALIESRRPALGLFMRANSYSTGEDENRDTEDDSWVGTDAAAASLTAAAEATGGNHDGDDRMYTASWAADVQDNPDTRDVDESMTNQLTIMIDLDTNNPNDELVSDTEGDADADPIVHANAKSIDGVGDFMHGFDITERNVGDDTATPVEDGSLRVIAFTDKEQATAASSTTVTVKTRAESDRIETLDAAEDGGTGRDANDETIYNDVGYDHDGDPNTPALDGELQCIEDAPVCSLTESNGEVTVVGYNFVGSGTITVEADPKNDYLLFGIWSDTTVGFGAFATGGEPYTAANIDAGLEGTATYEGSAVGAHHITDGPVSYFEGDASLTADFDVEDDAETGDTEVASIEGTIDNIRVNGGDVMDDPIHLVMTNIINGSNTFSGAAVMGMQTGPGQTAHTFNGTWSGGFYGNNPDDPDQHPGSVAGTFGVSHTDEMDNTDPADDVTESFVGAFGAHNTKDE